MSLLEPATSLTSPHTSEPAAEMADAWDMLAGWRTEFHALIGSTTERARLLPPWHAVLAAEQTAGRGQYERVFVSNRGGLFLSAVVPAPGGAREWVGFSLVVGWSLLSMLRRWHVKDARLRWPNDLMVGSRKLGGILIEQAGPETLVVGIGINLTNKPWVTDPELGTVATRVRDCAPTVPGILKAAEDTLRAVRVAHHEMRGRGLAGMQDRINGSWGNPRRVELDLGEERTCTGRFGGIDETGRLLVWTGAGTLRSFAAHHVHRLRELPEEGGDMYAPG